MEVCFISIGDTDATESAAQGETEEEESREQAKRRTRRRMETDNPRRRGGSLEKKGASRHGEG